MVNITRKYGAIRNYIRILPLALSKSYGHSNVYSECQVRNAVKEHRLNKVYILYALLYCDEEIVHKKAVMLKQFYL